MATLTQTHARREPQTVAAPDSWAALPARIRELLKLEELDSPGAWRAAGSRRTQIFGIPTPLIRRLDELARERL